RGGGRTCALLLDRPAARGLTALQQHRAPHHGAFLLEEEEQELPAAALDVNDVVALLQVAGDGRLVLGGSRHGGKAGNEQRSRERTRPHRSTSPKTISIEPRMADTSASM